MALVLADRVQETTTTTGTTDFALGGAVTGFQTFLAAIGNGNTCYYTAILPNTNEWEVGVGTLSGDTTLGRTTILASSNSGSAVDFSAGQKFVFVTYPAEKSVNLDASGNVSALGTVSSGTWQGSAISDTYLSTISTAGKVSNSATTATNANTASAIVARDASGNFSAGTITASLSGNASTATTSSSVANAVTFNNSGSGAASGTTFDGSVARTISYDTIGAQPAGTYVTSVSGSGVISSSGGTTPAISISQATTSTSGYLSSTDWNTFNSKGSGTVTSVSGTSPIVSSGGTTPAISIPQASGSVSGYLSSTDWTTFNNKTSNTGTVTSVSGTGTASGLTLSGTVTTSGSLTLSGTVNSLAAGTYGVSISGNSATATTLIGDQTSWASYRSSAVANMLGWKNYGNGHIIFDASNSTSPTGSAVNNTNAQIAWASTYPTLMGWNGANTYGVRVDSARIADNVSGVVAVANGGTGASDAATARSNLGAAATQGTASVFGGAKFSLSGTTLTITTV